MPWNRWIIYALPLALVLLTVWSAVQARASRAIKGKAEIVVASSDAEQPSLNPYLPSGEAGREMHALLHEPLLKMDEQGRITSGLIESWSWSQTVSFWFAQEKFAQQAAEALRKADAAQGSRLRLGVVDAVGNELRLIFAEPDPRAGARVMDAVAGFGPLPVETVRVELQEPAESHHNFFMQSAVERDQVKDVWFDGTNAYEVKVSGEALRLFEELSNYYQNRPALGAKVRLVGKQPYLARPVLELQMREGATFHDGTPVTSSDVARTLRLIAEQPWPVAGRDVFQRIHTLDSTQPDALRLGFRETYGPFPVALVDLPVLPGGWIRKYAREFETGHPFETDPPPGTGLYKLAAQGKGSIQLSRLQAVPEDSRSRLQFVFGRSPGNIRTGFAMNAVDVFWPASASAATLAGDSQLRIQTTPPRNRLLVLWNCRRAPLDQWEVRQALGEIVDRELLLKDLLRGEGSIHEGIFRPDLWFSSERPVKPADPYRASQTLAGLGWSQDLQGRLVKGGEVFRIELMTVSGNAERMALARRLAQAWGEYGIEVVITAVSWDEMLRDRLPQHRFDAVLLGLDYEVTWDQSPFWHSSQAPHGLNYSGIADAPLDNLLDALRLETDLERVPVLAKQVEDRLLALHPFLPLFSGANVMAIRRSVATGGDKSAGLRRLLGTPAVHGAGTATGGAGEK
ncbi:ABC-type transport system substrate-binding protein [Roseimicrobium gellanilyticum]|uniref:ABC-type transport system substrate-binding protein n=1 Tax=Roseimicrobium gellanilyticum TaxID=748857 RepID=A0A366HNM8_9BACT|nr:ABC transporter substrate-binding protein [Roseimicrobium gellanilyticum]RBP43922.1 ABC-type transport system substrate-binding protein [Roseimicrobium gellanilyticum]